MKHIKNKKIYPSMYFFSEKDIDFVLKNFKTILANNEFLTNGRYTEKFERAFAHYIGSRYAVATNSGTSALELILSALNVRGREVVVTTNTFAATIFAIIKAGGIPIFADIMDDMTIDPIDVEKKISKNTAAVVTVHIGGLVSPATEKLVELCRERKLYLVEDAAHAHGSALNNKKAGTFGIAGSFSFFSTKVMTTGEGGMVVTDSDELANKMRVIRDQAKVNNRNYHKMIGYNWRMTEIEALMGLTQLKSLDKFIEKRQRLAHIFDEELNNSGMKLLKIPKNVRHNYYKYFVFLPDGILRERFQKELKEKFGIPLSGCAYEIPCHLQPVFKMYKREALKNAERLAKAHIALPIYYQMSEGDARLVAKAIKNTFKTLKEEIE